LCASQVDFVVGTFMTPTEEQEAKGFVGYSAATFQENLYPHYTYDHEANKMNSFFSVFAVFFPAVTGIVAGANLSGDLRDPATAIPKGTMLAIFFTMFTYLLYGLLSGGCSVRYASGIVAELHFAKGLLNESTIEELNITQAFNNCTGRSCSYGLIMSQQMMEVECYKIFNN
jgi:amino acid transporter